MIEIMFEKWLEQTHNGLTNKEKYADIINELKIAFQEGFKAKLIYSTEEYLQK